MTESRDRIPLREVQTAEPKPVRVKVGSPGVTVEIETAGEPYWEVVDKALEVFRLAGGGQQTPGPASAVGFSGALRLSPPAQPSSMYRAPRLDLTPSADAG